MQNTHTHTHTQNNWCNPHSWSSTYKDVVLRIFFCHIDSKSIQKSNSFNLVITTRINMIFLCFKLLFLKSPKFLIPTPLGWCNPLTPSIFPICGPLKGRLQSYTQNREPHLWQKPIIYGNWWLTLPLNILVSLTISIGPLFLSSYKHQSLHISSTST
jgi:hypothetical protein